MHFLYTQVQICILPNLLGDAMGIILLHNIQITRHAVVYSVVVWIAVTVETMESTPQTLWPLQIL